MDAQTAQALTLLGVPAKWLAIAGAVVFLMTHIIPWLPVPAVTGSLYGAIYSLLSRLAGNYGNAANAVQPTSTGIRPGPLAMAFVAALALAACAVVPPAPKTAEQVIYETGVGLDAALKQAATYAELPRCVALGNPICSQPKVVAELDDKATRAVAAYGAARGVYAAYSATGRGDLAGAATAAAGALAALQSVVKESR